MKSKYGSALTAVLILILSGLAWSADPKTIRFQGRLTDSRGKPISNSINGSIAIYASETGGSPLWGPHAFPGGTTANESGLFTMDIGPFDDPSIFLNNNYLYLQINIKGGTGQNDQALSPRQRLAYVPMAFYSQMAASAAVAGSVSDNSISTVKIQDNAVDSSKILDRSIQSVDIASRTILSSHIAEGGVKGINIEDESITPEKLNVASFTSSGLMIPPGAVFMFLGSCPDGYNEIEEFRNRFVIGADTAGTDSAVPNTPGNFIASTLNHNHNVNSTVNYGNQSQAFDDRSTWNYLPEPSAVTAVQGSPVSGAGILGRPFTVTSTTDNKAPMPAGFTVLFCRKGSN